MKSILNFIYIISVATTVCSCGGGQQDVPARKSSHPDLSVVSVARNDAQKIMDAAGDARELEHALLDARAKECFMRSRGLEATADLYITTIGQAVADSLPDLANEINIGGQAI